MVINGDMNPIKNIIINFDPNSRKLSPGSIKVSAKTMGADHKSVIITTFLFIFISVAFF